MKQYWEKRQEIKSHRRRKITALRKLHTELADKINWFLREDEAKEIEYRQICDKLAVAGITREQLEDEGCPDEFDDEEQIEDKLLSYKNQLENHQTSLAEATTDEDRTRYRMRIAHISPIVADLLETLKDLKWGNKKRYTPIGEREDKEILPLPNCSEQYTRAKRNRSLWDHNPYGHVGMTVRVPSFPPTLWDKEDPALATRFDSDLCKILPPPPPTWTTDE